MHMKIIPFLALAFPTLANASPITWQLEDFQFNDGGTAHGSFTYDSVIDQFSDIDIFTTAGSTLDGRHYFSTAGEWGSIPSRGVLAFSDFTGINFTGAGWFRIDANIDFEASPGTIVNQWLAVGAESFCVNFSCSSAANEITNPGHSRETISGYLVAASTVPEPSVPLLFASGLIALSITRKLLK